jgi:hypothetical protein
VNKLEKITMMTRRAILKGFEGCWMAGKPILPAFHGFQVHNRLVSSNLRDIHSFEGAAFQNIFSLQTFDFKHSAGICGVFFALRNIPVKIGG